MTYGDGPFLDIGMHAADGNYGWDGYVYNGDPRFGGAPGPYLYSSFSTANGIGAALQYGAKWWWRDFGEGGIWDIKAWHVTGFDVAIYSIRIDGREVGRIDGYSGPDINNTETVISGVRIGPGRHRLSVHMDGHSPLCTGLPWYPAMQGLLLRQTAPLASPPAFGSPKPRFAPAGQVINLIPLFASGNTNWDSLQVTAAMASGYELYSTGAQNAARWWDLDLVAGQWDVDLMVATFSSAGIISVQVDGATQATIDTYSASTTYGVRKTARISVGSSGTHRLTLLMATKNGSSSNYTGDLSNLQLRQVPGNPHPLPQRQFHFVAAGWAHGEVNWTTLFPTAGYVLGGDIESSGAQGAARWWWIAPEAGTWALDFLYAVGPNRGIISIRLDDREVATLDGYSVAGTANQRATVSGIVIASSGFHKLGFVMASKHASSSSYYGTITALALRRTA